MNKIFYLLLIALIVCSIKCVDTCDDDNSSNPSVDYCNSLRLADGDYRCCFVEYSGGKFCQAVTKDEYDDIDKAIDDVESNGYGDVDIDCGSKYIITSLLTLIFILL